MASNSVLPALLLHNALQQIPFEWLRGRRWFSSKGRTIESISIGDWGELALAEPAIVAIAIIRYSSGRDEHYFLPLIASPEATLANSKIPAAMAIEYAGATWYLHDAFQFGSFQRLLIEQLLNSGTLALEAGQLLFHPEAALLQAPPALTEIKLVTAEQSNSSIIYDRKAILKCFRRIVAGMNPDVEVSHFLSSKTNFRNTPQMLGSISYSSHTGIEHSVGMLQSFIHNTGDAWAHVLNQLSQFIIVALAAAPTIDQAYEAVTNRLAAEQLAEIEQLGNLTGQMHLALASDPTDPDFAPRPLTAAQVQSWQAAITAESQAILAELEQRADSFPAAQQAIISQLLHARPAIEQRIAQLSLLSAAGLVITRYHGDYHLGQILVSELGLLVLDFEGEPLRSLAERRAHSSPLKDLAGMLRSLSYAGASVQMAQQVLPSEQAQLAAWISAWEQAARKALINGYLSATEGAAFVPSQPSIRDTAIAVFELEKALYELNYELNNRPDWLAIPLHGILRVIG